MISRHDVLVVDDDAATRVLLETLLARLGLSVLAAADGEQAMDALNRFQFDAIVTDLFMPRLNGIDLLERLHHERPESLSRVIVLSAAPERSLAIAREKYGVWCALRKPPDISDLMQTVLDCIQQNQNHDHGGAASPRQVAP